MDAIDKKLLDLLQNNAEMTVQELSKEVHLSTTPCWKRINQLKKLGYINKTVALIDRKRIGLNVTAIVFVTVNTHDQEKISIFAISTFDTDYILVRTHDMSSATTKLKQAGYKFE